MNKRGQVYILAAIVLIIAIWGVMKVVNKVEGPSKQDNFDFYVENFLGERAYVMDLGYLQTGDPTEHFLKKDNGLDDDLLDVFTKAGFNVGVVMIIYDNKPGNEDKPWKVINLLKSQVITGCNGCGDDTALPSGQEEIGGLTFSLSDDGKKFSFDENELRDLPGGRKYFMTEFSDVPDIYIDIEGNKYTFNSEGRNRRIESILFKNLDDDYVKVVRV
ncbi:hypothetical protein HYT56_01725 [Candidatus Woesearchaeota archaeon]|nr:hypothetical protein [Candidatus Woesearchaeota archaeon]